MLVELNENDLTNVYASINTVRKILNESDKISVLETKERINNQVDDYQRFVNMYKSLDQVKRDSVAYTIGMLSRYFDEVMSILELKPEDKPHLIKAILMQPTTNE